MNNYSIQNVKKLTKTLCFNTLAPLLKRKMIDKQLKIIILTSTRIQFETTQPRTASKEFLYVLNNNILLLEFYNKKMTLKQKENI